MSAYDAMRELAAQQPDHDADARARLVEAVRPLVVRTTRLIVGAGTPDAEDAAQDALVDVIRGIGGLRETEAIHTWALRIATRRAVKVARRRRLHFRTDIEELRAEPSTDPAMWQIKQAFDSLPPRMRAVAVLRLYVGLNVAETAEVLRCSEGAVKAHLHHARRRLRRYLGGTEGDR